MSDWTPEREAAALRLAALHAKEPTGDEGNLARAVLHFAEQAEAACREHALGYGAQEGLMQRALVAEAERDALKVTMETDRAGWQEVLEGESIVRTELMRQREALKADVARLHADLVALRLAHATGLPIGAIRDRLAAAAPPETPE